MTTDHNNMARIAAETMLYNWKHSIWSNDVISQDIFLAKTVATFPSPDGSFRDDGNQLHVAFEFKPPNETKRGLNEMGWFWRE